MTPFLRGFTDELVKHAGLLGGAVKFVAKHPMATLGGAAIAGMTGYQAVNAYREGQEAGSRPQQLQATPGHPSDAAYTNYHQLFGHDLSPTDKAKLSENFKPELARK